jgi:hypothetical protein
MVIGGKWKSIAAEFTNLEKVMLTTKKQSYVRMREGFTTPYELATIVENIQSIHNSINAGLISEFHQYMIENDSSERHQNNNLKAIIYFARFLCPAVSF